MIVVHHLNNSRSQRVLWLLEELQLPYEVRRYQRDPKTMLAPAALKQVHPLGKSPVVTDGDVTVAESGAIVEYLLDTYDDGSRGNGPLRPAPGTPERRRFTYWLHYAEGSAMPPLLLGLIFGRLPTQKMPFFAKPIVKAMAQKAQANFIGPQQKAHMDWIESELVGREWFAGDAFSAADIQMSFPLEAFAARGGLDASKPHLWAWLQRIHARPAYAKALEVGGPYELMR
jgi:glutathione S-transferase